MYPAHSETNVLLHVGESHSRLPEILSDAGFSFSLPGWGCDYPTPTIVVTDRCLQCSDRSLPTTDRLLLDTPTADGNVASAGPQIHQQLASGSWGLVMIGNDDAPNYPHLVHLPPNPGREELIRSLSLLTRLIHTFQAWQQEKAECQRWIQLAMHDPLTSLPNRRCWEQELSRYLAGRKPIAVGLIDVDYFKRINDRNGHPIGDQVLCEAAKILRSSLRPEDVVARLGGDEFGLILTQVNHAIATQIIDRIRIALPKKLAECRLPMATMSTGFITLSPDEVRDGTQVFAAASNALQAAKRRDRNRTIGHANRRHRPISQRSL